MAARIGFSGFLTGSQVGINAANQSRNTSAEGWGVANAAGTPRATIVPKRGNLQVAPEGLNFEVVLENFDTPGPSAATGNYDPQFHEVYYFWSFGDPGTTFSAPEKILPEHRDANVAFGSLASHTFSAPGSYLVTVDVIEPASGKTAQATLPVNVGNAESLFAGAQTLYVDPDSDFSNAPGGALTFTSLNAAYAQAGQSTGPADYYRIMLSRAKQHVWTDPAQMRPPWKNLWVCSEPGAGARAEILGSRTDGNIYFLTDNCTNQEFGKKTDIVFHDVDISGLWDASLEEPQANKTNFLWHSPNRATYTLFHNVNASGWDTFWADQSAGSLLQNDMVQVGNNLSITNWGNFGIYMDYCGSLGLTGCKVAQRTDALSGGSKGFGHNEHGPLRLQSPANTVIDACDIFGRNGWFPNTVGMYTSQPGIRFAQAFDSAEAKLNLQRTSVEGPGTALALTRQNAGQEAFPINMLVDKCHLIGGLHANYLVIVHHGGLSMRNCVLNHPAVDRSNYGTFRINHFIHLEMQAGSGPETEACPMRFYNNTYVSMTTYALNGNKNIDGFLNNPDYGSGSFSDIVEANSLPYLPNENTPNAPHAIDTTVLFAPRYDGYRDRRHPFNGTLTAAVPDGGSFTIPYGSFGGGVVGASDFDLTSTDPRHQPVLNVGGNVVPTNFSMTTDGTGVVVTNNSGSTWANGQSYIAVPVRDSSYFRPEYQTPADTIIRAAPTAGSTALGAAISGPTAVDDMLGNTRPAFPSIGAYELP